MVRLRISRIPPIANLFSSGRESVAQDFDIAHAYGVQVDVRRDRDVRVPEEQLAHPAAGGVEPQPVEIPHHAAASAAAERRDRVEPVDGQLAQALKVGALATEALEQEGRVGDRQFMLAVDRRVAVGCVVVLRPLSGHLVW